jgi:large subunit ribosomal protein L7A
VIKELKTANRVVGIKQLRRALRDGTAQIVFLADDADPWMRDEIMALCSSAGISLVRVNSMKELGAACGISVGAATAAVLRAAEN